MPNGTCRLCDSETELRHSHVLPGFIYRWLRESSGNGHFRNSHEPNLRVQDGLKRYWLCSVCEELFSASETAFANRLLYASSEAAAVRIPYEHWLLHFCVSVSWRVLLLNKEETALKAYDAEAVADIDAALSTWKEFLLGRRSHPGRFEQHLLPFDQIESMSPRLLGRLSPNFTRYLTRAIDIDFCHGTKLRPIFTYAKLGRFVITGFIRDNPRRRWQGSKVHVRKGILEPRKYILPVEFLNYVDARARHAAEVFAKISPRQSEKIETAFRKDLDRFIGSDQFTALENDIRLFGDAAFAEPS